MINGRSQMGVNAPIKTMAICNHESIDSGIPRSRVPSDTNDTPLAMRIPLPKIQPASMYTIPTMGEKDIILDKISDEIDISKYCNRDIVNMINTDNETKNIIFLSNYTPSSSIISNNL